MTPYRSKETINAVQYTGEPITDVTCHGTEQQVAAMGCDSSRKQHPHVHTAAVGGMTVLKPGDWIFPMQGGPFGVAADGQFRAHWEVPMVAPVVEAAAPATFPATQPAEVTPPVPDAVDVATKPVTPPSTQVAPPEDK